MQQFLIGTSCIQRKCLSRADITFCVMTTNALVTFVFSFSRQVIENVENAQVKQKNTFAKRQAKGVKVFQLKTGDLVLRREMRNINRKGDQMKSKWIGPYRYYTSCSIKTILCSILDDHFFFSKFSVDQGTGPHIPDHALHYTYNHHVFTT